MTFKKGVILFIVLLQTLHTVDAAAQKKGSQEIIDSLFKVLPDAEEDSNKANILDALSYNYWYIDPGKGLKYGMQELQLAKKLGLQDIVARANSVIGGNYQNKTDYNNALKYEYEALKWYEKSGNTRKAIMMLNNVGIVCRNNGDIQQALKYDSIALKKCDEIHDTSGKALVLGNIGNIYHRQKNYAKALDFFSVALKLNEQLGNKDHAAINLGNIGNVYADQGYSAKALEYYFKAIRMYEESGNKGGVAINLGNIGETFLEIAKDTSGSVKPDSLVPQGKNANLERAIDHLKKSIAISAEIGRLDYLIEYTSSLSEAYMLTENYKDAFEVYKQFITTRDSVDNLAKDKEVARRQMDYEYGKHEDAIRYEKKLSGERYIAGIAVLTLFSFFVYRNLRQQKRSNAIITKEKKRSEDLLLNILPAEVAEELKAKGTAAAHHFDHVTVIFTDFVNFTLASERMQPQQLIDELDACFKAFDGIMGKHKIEKIKTVGDAYLAVSGLPAADPKHAEHIINAACEIREFMLERKKQIGDRTFEIRIGVHSGSVVAGIVGVKKFAYDIWGDTVNTAARMEQNSEAGKINISETTYELVKDKVACEYRGEIEAKNKGMLKMYFVS